MFWLLLSTQTHVKMLNLMDKNMPKNMYEPRHDISNSVVCMTSKASDQPVHMRSLIKAIASRLDIL